MPLYEYECEKCGHRFEKIQKFSDKMVKKCPECGGKVEQMISAPAVQFKGSGWYVTDYANKSHPPFRRRGKDSKKEDKSKSDGSSKEGSSRTVRRRTVPPKKAHLRTAPRKRVPAKNRESTTRVSSSRKPDKRK